MDDIQEEQRAAVVDKGERFNTYPMVFAIPAAVVLTTGIAMLVTARPWKDKSRDRKIRLRAGVGHRSGGISLEGRF